MARYMKQMRTSELGCHEGLLYCSVDEFRAQDTLQGHLNSSLNVSRARDRIGTAERAEETHLRNGFGASGSAIEHELRGRSRMKRSVWYE